MIDLAGSRDGAHARLGDFYPGTAQAAKIVRRRKVEGRWLVHTIYVITSQDATQVDPALLATWVRDHWGIEVRLHWLKDVTWGQDARQVRAGNGPANFSAFTITAINALRLTGQIVAQITVRLLPTRRHRSSPRAVKRAHHSH